MSCPLSVIIPTYNRSGYVRDCLLALREAGVPDLDVLVADDGSTDDTAAVVAATEPAARYLWQPNSGTPETTRNVVARMGVTEFPPAAEESIQ
jgi:glycosyltransferase involved in cell wall biosynthesis